MSISWPVLASASKSNFEAVDFKTVFLFTHSDLYALLIDTLKAFGSACSDDRTIHCNGYEFITKACA